MFNLQSEIEKLLKKHPMAAKWLIPVVVLTAFVFGSCEKKLQILPEITSHVNEISETLVEAETVEDDFAHSTLQNRSGLIPEMVFVAGGIFDYHGEQIEVDDFYISKFEITERIISNSESWAKKNNIQNDDYFSYPFKIDSYLPNFLGWYDALYICNLLSIQAGFRPVYYLDNKLMIMLSFADIEFGKIEDNTYLDFYIDNTANGYRLPTEVEWEYAARGGKQSRGFIYSGGNIPEEVAYYGIQSPDFIRVGLKKENELMIYDMSGNTHEWCIDWWSEEPLNDSALRNDVYFYEATNATEFRLIKGGFNYDINQIYYEQSNEEYIRPEARLKMDVLRTWYRDNTSGYSTEVYTTRNTQCLSGLRLVQKRQEVKEYANNE